MQVLDHDHERMLLGRGLERGAPRLRKRARIVYLGRRQTDGRRQQQRDVLGLGDAEPAEPPHRRGTYRLRRFVLADAGKP